MLPASVFAPRPRRLVDRRGNWITVTRRSAPARITALPQEVSQVTSELVTSPEAANIPACSPRVTNVPPRDTVKTKRPQRRRVSVLDSTLSHSSEDDSDSDSCYITFIHSLRKKDVLRLESHLGVDDALDRTLSKRSMSPSPTLQTSPHSKTAVYRILKAQYSGNTVESGNLSAQLTVGPTKRPGQAESARPLFKWVHLENPEMNFGAYLEYVTKCPYLNDTERSSALRILRTAREKSDRSLRMTPGTKGSYVEPEYFEETIESIIHQGLRSKDTKRQVVRWISIPYFYITPSPSDGHGDEIDSSLQFSRKGYIAKGDFFEVAQLWCLMLGDGIIISCARVSVPDLPSSLIHLNFVPPADTTKSLPGDRAPMLQVGDGGLRLWLLPVSECESWSSFVSHFIGLGFSLINEWQVNYRGVTLEPSDWGAVIEIAKRCPVKLEIRRSAEEIGDDEEYATPDEVPLKRRRSQWVSESETHDTVINHNLQNSTQPSSSSLPFEAGLLFTLDGPRDKPEPQADDLHIFTLLATVPSTSPSLQASVNQATSSPQYKVDKRQLDHDLTELDQYFSTRNTRSEEILQYIQCSTKTTSDVNESCAKLDPQDRPEWALKRALVKAARDIFELFFPLKLEHTVTSKFWGSVDRIVQTKDKSNAHRCSERIVAEASQLGRIAKELKQDILSSKNVHEYVGTVPDDLIQAWMLIQVYFIYSSTEGWRIQSKRFQRCKEKLLQGRLKMAQRLQKVCIREREAVLPLGINILLMGQMLHDSQGPVTVERHRLTSAYWSFFKNLKTEVYEKPLKRSYEAVFTSLKSEFETVIGTLEDQQRVLVALEQSIDEAENHSFAYSLVTKSWITMEPSREASVTEYLLHQTREMLQNFSEMSRRLSELENYHFLSLSIDNDMQQKASFAFTTVTVFFLPLTTLSGILGMNTSDIRDMNSGQWVFWAVGVPLCIACLGVWLSYLGSFEKLWRWSKKKHFRKEKMV